MTMSAGGHAETELKRLLVGQRAVERLVDALGGAVAQRRLQTNYVFDTADLSLSRARHTLRLRVEPGAALLTAKGPTREVGTSTGSRTEAEIAIEPDLAAEVLRGGVDPLRVLRTRLGEQGYERLWRDLDAIVGARPLELLGSFENERSVVRAILPGGLPVSIEIDRTRFPRGRTDEEVEIEVPDERAVRDAEEWLDQTLDRAGIASMPSSPKIARFHAALRGGSEP
jgi:uncharacterized protein YjbK